MQALALVLCLVLCAYAGKPTVIHSSNITASDKDVVCQTCIQAAVLEINILLNEILNGVIVNDCEGTHFRFKSSFWQNSVLISTMNMLKLLAMRSVCSLELMSLST